MSQTVDADLTQGSRATSPGPGPVLIGPFRLAFVAVVLGLIAVAALYLLVQLWPSSVGVGETPPTTQAVFILGTKYDAVPRETLFFAVVILAGALGGSIHSIRSLAWYAGGQRLMQSWILRYLFLPLVGALLATILYIIVRAGFLAGTSVDASSPFGFAALAALAGLFSDQGVLKLRQVFETLLTEAEQGPHPKDQPATGSTSE